EVPLTSRWPASDVTICWSKYFARLSRAAGTASSNPAHTANVVHCPSADQIADRRRSGSSQAIAIGAASGNSPTGPFDSTAPGTPAPAIPPRTIAAGGAVGGVAIRAATAAVTNTQTVVSSRFPTIDHETTGASIQNATASHSCSARPLSPSYASRQMTMMSVA